MARTDTLEHFLTDVASALKTKKGDQTDILASDFDTEITNLPSGTAVAPSFVSFYKAPAGTDISWLTDTSNLTSCDSMFANAAMTGEIDLSSWDLSNVTTFNNMFGYSRFSKIIMPNTELTACTAFTSFLSNNSNLTEVVFPQGCDMPNITTFATSFGGYTADMPNFTKVDMSAISAPKVTNCSGMFRSLRYLTTCSLPNNFGEKVSNMQHMFENCSLLTTIGNLFTVDSTAISNYDLSSMFYGCTNLLSVDLSHLVKTANTIRDMFRDCTSITSINLSGLKSRANIPMGNAFYGCTSLQYLDLRNMTMYSNTGTNIFGNESDLTTCVPNNCEIIVQDNTSKTWFTNNYPRFTNVKTVAEL